MLFSAACLASIHQSIKYHLRNEIYLNGYPTVYFSLLFSVCILTDCPSFNMIFPLVVIWQKTLFLERMRDKDNVPKLQSLNSICSVDVDLNCMKDLPPLSFGGILLMVYCATPLPNISFNTRTYNVPYVYRPYPQRTHIYILHYC